MRWNGYCWYISKDDRLTFEAAEAACSQVNSRARLASIHDEFDNRFLAGKLLYTAVSTGFWSIFHIYPIMTVQAWGEKKGKKKKAGLGIRSFDFRAKRSFLSKNERLAHIAHFL